MINSFFHLRSPSLLRGNILTLGSLAISFPLARFPFDHATPAMIFPVLVVAAGIAETFRCIQVHWSWYHGAVVLSLYMDTLVLTMIFFLALYPLLTQ